MPQRQGLATQSPSWRFCLLPFLCLGIGELPQEKEAGFHRRAGGNKILCAQKLELIRHIALTAGGENHHSQYDVPRNYKLAEEKLLFHTDFEEQPSALHAARAP